MQYLHALQVSAWDAGWGTSDARGTNRPHFRLESTPKPSPVVSCKCRRPSGSLSRCDVLKLLAVSRRARSHAAAPCWRRLALGPIAYYERRQGPLHASRLITVSSSKQRARCGLPIQLVESRISHPWRGWFAQG